MPARKQDQTDVRTKLAALRRERGISQASMALAVGLSASTYRRLERGQVANPPLRYLTNAAIALAVPLEDVIEDEWREWMVFDEVSASKPPDRALLWKKKRDSLAELDPRHRRA